MRTFFGMLLAWALLMAAYPAPGQVETPEEGEPAEGAVERIDQTHAYLSEQLEAFSRKVDSFFGGDRIYDEATGSVFRLGGSATLRPGGEVDYDYALRARLVLPYTQRRFRFLLESDPDEEAQRELARRETPLPAEEQEDRATLAALSLVLRETRRWSLSSDGGIKVRFPPDPFVRARARRTVPFERWVFRATETVFWFHSIGLGESTRVDFDRPLGETFLFRFSSEAVWSDEKGRFDLGQSLLLFQELSDRHSLAYQATVEGVTEPNWQATVYKMSIRYRRKIYQDWLFLELRPEAEFPKEEDFRLDPSLTLKLEALIGEEYR